MQYKEVAGGICAPKGFAAAGVHCGIRANHSEKYDLALIKADVRCAAAGVYTTNKVCGAPIKVDRAHLKDGYAQAITGFERSVLTQAFDHDVYNLICRSQFLAIESRLTMNTNADFNFIVSQSKIK